MLKYLSPSRPWKTPGSGGKAGDDLCYRGEETDCGSMCLVGWADAAFGRKESADWEPVDGRKVPIGLRDRHDVVDIYGSAPCLVMDIQVPPEAGSKQLGRWSLRTK